MQRRVLLGAGAAILVIAAVTGFRNLGRHAAVKVVDQDIDQITSSLPPGYTATHGATDVNPITGTATIRKLVISRDGRTVFSADTVTLTGVDQQALHEVFDPAAYGPGHTAWTARRLLIADATASGVVCPESGSPPGEARISSITLHRLSGRPFLMPPTRDQVASRAFRADAALAFALQGLDVHDLSVQTKGLRPTHFTLGAFTLRDYDGGKLGKAALEHGAMDVADDKPTPTHLHATLTSLEVKDVNAAATLRKVQTGVPPVPGGLGFMRGGSFRLSGLALDVSPGPRITLGSAEAHGSPAGESRPGDGEAAVRELTFALKDTPLQPGPAALVDAFGMKSLSMDITARSTSDPASHHLTLIEDIALRALGTLHFSLDAGLNIPAGYTADPRMVLLTTSLNHATLEWHDDGLVGRAFNAAAAQMHTTPDVVRGQLAMPIITLGFLMPDQPDAADQLTSFINHPGTLTVTLDPPRPVTLAEVGKAAADQRARLLGAHIQSK